MNKLAFLIFVSFAIFFVVLMFQSLHSSSGIRTRVLYGDGDYLPLTPDGYLTYDNTIPGNAQDSMGTVNTFLDCKNFVIENGSGTYSLARIISGSLDNKSIVKGYLGDYGYREMVNKKTGDSSYIWIYRIDQSKQVALLYTLKTCLNVSMHL